MLKSWKVISIVAAGVVFWSTPVRCTPTIFPKKIKTATVYQLLHQIDTLIETGGYAIRTEGRIAYAKNLERTFIPASIIKIVTALASLKILGPDYRFITRFYVNEENDLYIQGTGDPFLVSEEVAFIMDHLKRQGTEEIRDIVLDDSAFSLPDPAEGSGVSDNPYDAGNSALAVNFNTVYFIKDAQGMVRSAEPQTPFLPLMAELGKDLGPGTYRFNISVGNNDFRMCSVRHTGELFRAFQAEKEIGGKGVVRHEPVPEGLVPLYVHRSRITVLETVRRLMQYSNNFVANQLFLACGAKRSGYPATWEKSKTALQDFLDGQLALSKQDIVMVEGSGLSRRNRITPAAMLAILEAFKPFAFVLQPLNKNKDWILAKSGTMSGIFSYSGYFLHEQELDGFVLILNQNKNHRNRILDILERLYRHSMVLENEGRTIAY